MTGTAATSGSGGNAGNAGSGGTAPALDCGPPVGTVGSLVLTPVVTEGLSSPVLVTSAPGDATRLYVVEQGGVVRIIKDGVLSPTPFLDISSRVENDGQRGLLGLAFHPDFANNRRVFVHHSWSDPAAEPGVAAVGDTIVGEYVATDADAADGSTWKLVLTQSQPEATNNGGSLEFGSDGMLYLGLGDGGGVGDPHGTIGNAQDPQTWLGKILRIDVTAPADPGLAYAIPSGNMAPPFLSEIWDYGLRNPYRFSFDACTGALYVGDVGQDAFEEIDVEPAGAGNRNYGWRLMEGNACYLPAIDCDPGGLTAPVFTYSHSDPDQGGAGSVTGGYVYRGSTSPALRGAYVFGDFVSAKMWLMRWDGSSPPTVTELSAGGMALSSFGQDTNGEVYVVDYNGGIYRLDQE